MLEEEDPLKPLESKKKNQELSHKDNKHQLAVGTYKKLFWVICAYIILVLLLLTGNKHYFQLESLVLIALLSSQPLKTKALKDLPLLTVYSSYL
jgi:hypothetical protein